METTTICCPACGELLDEVEINNTVKVECKCGHDITVFINNLTNHVTMAFSQVLDPNRLLYEHKGWKVYPNRIESANGVVTSMAPPSEPETILDTPQSKPS